MTYKRTKVIMLPTNEKSNALWWSGQKLYNKPPEDPSRGELNHLYFLSDEEIKEGDWVLYNSNHNSKNPKWELLQCNKIERKEMYPHFNNKLLLWMKKIIATTNGSLFTHQKETIHLPEKIFYLPKPTIDFIDQYKEYFNKGEPIKQVDVKYSICSPGMCLINDMTCGHSGCKSINTKINSNNEISIKTIKDSYTRDEVIELFKKYQYDYAQGILKTNKDIDNRPIPIEWIEQNLD